MGNTLLQRLQTLDASKQAALNNADAILSKMATENRASFTPDEKTAFDGFTQEAKSIQQTIESAKELAAIMPQGNIHTDAPRTGAGSGVQVYDNILDKPWVSEASTGETKKERASRLCVGFGEYLSAVRTAAIRQSSGGRGDPRLFALNESYEKRAAAAGASEFVPSDGGFLVAPDFSDRLLELAHETGVVYPLADLLPLGEFTNSIKIPAIDEQSRKDGSRSGGVQIFWEQEAQAFVGSKPTFALLELVLAKLTGLYYATDELLADTRQLGTLVMRLFSQELGFKLDDGLVRGTGSGQMLGILNAPCLVTIAKETGQAATTVVWENIKKAWGRMHSKSRPNAVWFINQDVEQQLYGMGQTVGVGGLPVYLPPTGAAGVPYATLFGRPVIAIEQCSTLGSVGDVILADFGQYLMIDKGGLQTASSMHVQFLTGQMTYRWVYRTQGAPWWKTALTPAQGSATQSPFVVIAAR